MTTPSASPYPKRLERLREALASADLDGLAFNPGPTLTYLTGLHFHLSERPVVAFFNEGTPVIVLPALEKAKLASASFEMQAFTYTEDPTTWAPAFRKGLEAAGLQGQRVGVEPRSLRVLELRLLEAGGDGAHYDNGEDVVAELRMYKDRHELAEMRKAVGVAQRAVKDTLAMIKEGVTEREVAAELVLNLLRGGSSAELPFDPIVAFGAESANPHANPRDYKLQQGDLVLIDWGANVNGYYSDLTRMFSFGEPDEELQKITAIVAEANAAGRAKAAPGVPAGDVDRAVRQVIADAGYGEYFVHRTGHGLGLETHEEPYIRDDNRIELAVGMTFTIEPGIYLPGRGGARIEDDMVITSDGAESLSDLERSLVVLT